MTQPKGEINDGAITEARKQYAAAVAIREKAASKISEFSGIDALLTEAEVLFKDTADTQFVALARDAKIANKAITGYNNAEEKRLKDLDLLIKGVELAGDKKQSPSVAEVVKTNGSYDTMLEKAKPFMGDKQAAGAEAKPKEGEATGEAGKAGAASDVTKPDANRQAVDAKVKLAQEAVVKGDEAVAAMQKKKEAAEKADPPTTYNPTEEDKKPVVDAGTALGEMQKEQTSVQSAINGKLAELKAGTKPAETAGGTGATAALSNVAGAATNVVAATTTEKKPAVAGKKK